MMEAENLTRWQDSGDPHRFVWKCSGAWCVEEYAELLAALRAGPYWPMSGDDILKTLEKAANTYHDLKRWNLLGDEVRERTGDVADQPEDDEIWF